MALVQPSKARRFMREYKVLLAGVTGSGKTAIATRFTQSHFVEQYDPSQLEDSYRKQCVIDDEVVFITIHDSQGLQDHRDLFEREVNGADGVLFVYDISSRNSFEELMVVHQHILSIKATCPCLIVGNKCDLVVTREVSASEGEDLARKFGCKFREVSAEHGTNVDEAFIAVIREIREHEAKIRNETNIEGPLVGTSTVEFQAQRCCSCCIVV